MEPTFSFVGRQSFLETLAQNTQVALLGLHGAGKTALIHHYLRHIDREDQRRIGVYIHLQSAIASPIAFARHYVGRIVMGFCRKRGIRTDRINYLRGDVLLTESASLGSRALLRVLSILSDEDAKKEPDQGRVLAASFELPHELAREQGVKFLICLDEFQEIFKLNNFRAVPDILTILREAIEGRGGVEYLLSGSAVTVLKRLFVEKATPFFSQFRTLHLPPMETDEVVVLINQIAEIYGIQVPIEIGQEIGRLTARYPAYILPTVNRVCRDTLSSGEEEVSSERVSQAFVAEMFEPGGGVAESCRYLYQSALDRVRGGVLLQEILRMLAIDDGLILAHIARWLDKPNGEVANYCRALVESDLVVQNGRRFSVATPVLRCWLAGTALGFDGPGYEAAGIFDMLTPYMIAGQEAIPAGVRITDEGQVEDLLYSFAGQRIDGRFSGQRGDVILPIFNRIGRFTTRDGWTALDMTTETGEQWLAQISWDEKRCGRERIIEMTERMAKLRLSPSVAWYIARGGFTKEAMDYAREHGIWISSVEDLERVAAMIA